MYEAYWKLRTRPFGAGTDTHAYYPAELHKDCAIEAALYDRESPRRGVLVGPSGCGKTLLVRVLAEQLAEELRPFAHVMFPQMPPADLLAYLAAELDAEAGGTKTEHTSIDSSVRRIQQRLIENANQGRHAVVVIDEAHLLDGGRRGFEPLRLLLNFETEAGPALTLLLVGQTGLVPMLAPILNARSGWR